MTRVALGVVGLLAAAAAVAYFASREPTGSVPGPRDQAQVLRGEKVYGQHCASCHGASLECQAGWRQRLPSGRYPAPPHDATGRTWHHPDRILFGITKHGSARLAPPGYQSDMPAFDGVLSDAEIWAVLAYIKSRWPERARAVQAEATLRDASR